MTAESFCYWLQGYFELHAAGLPDGVRVMTIKQVEAVKRHLAMVFLHDIDPKLGDAKTQAELHKLHTPLTLPADWHSPKLNC